MAVPLDLYDSPFQVFLEVAVPPVVSVDNPMKAEEPSMEALSLQVVVPSAGLVTL